MSAKGLEVIDHTVKTEVVLLFRPVCSLFKMDQGFI